MRCQSHGSRQYKIKMLALSHTHTHTLRVSPSLSMTLSLSLSQALKDSRPHFLSTVCLQTPSLLSSAFSLGLFAPIWSMLVPVRPTMFIQCQSFWTALGPLIAPLQRGRIPQAVFKLHRLTASSRVLMSRKTPVSGAMKHVQ